MSDPGHYPGSRWLILISAVLSFVSLQVANLSIAPLLPVLGKDLGLAPGQLGNLMSMYTFAGALLMLSFGGAIVDRLGPLAGALFGMLAAGVPMALMPMFGHNYHALLWLRAIEGLSAGFAFPAQGPIIARWFGPNQKGLAGGIMGSSVTLGAAVGLIGGPALVNMGVSWQKMSLYLSCFAWVGIVFTLILMASKPQAPASAGPAPGKADKGLFRRALFTPLTFLGIATTFMVMWVFHSTLGVVPAALSTEKPLGAGYSALQSGSLMQAVTIAGIVGPILGGFLMDKVFKGNPKANMLLGFASMCIFVGSLLLPAVLYTPPLLVISLAMAGMGFQFIVPILFVYVGKMYPLPIVGQMVGLWIGIGTFGGVIGQAVGPALAQAKGSYLWAYGLMSLAAFIGFFLTIFMAKQKPVTLTIQEAG